LNYQLAIFTHTHLNQQNSQDKADNIWCRDHEQQDTRNLIEVYTAFGNNGKDCIISMRTMILFILFSEISHHQQERYE
jgi:hypothetical protein